MRISDFCCVIVLLCIFAALGFDLSNMPDNSNNCFKLATLFALGMLIPKR